MFQLDFAIQEWRRQMLAAGIQTPAPLEELESHLRDEVEHQMESGLNEPKAFDAAVQIIGQANDLKMEFQKTGESHLIRGISQALNPIMRRRKWFAPVTGIRLALSFIPFAIAIVLGLVKVNLTGQFPDGIHRTIQIPMLQLLWVQISFLLTALLYFRRLWRARKEQSDTAAT